MEQNICQQHNRDLEFFCKTDQMTICVVCLTKEHNDHDIIPSKTNQTSSQVIHDNSVRFKIIFLIYHKVQYKVNISITYFCNYRILKRWTLNAPSEKVFPIILYRSVFVCGGGGYRKATATKTVNNQLLVKLMNQSKEWNDTLLILKPYLIRTDLISFKQEL